MGSVISKILDDEREYRPLLKPVNKESVIKWQTGQPKEEGEYLVTLFNGEITFNEYCCITNSDEEEEFFWSNWDDDSIIAWCKLSDIKPYKDETNK